MSIFNVFTLMGGIAMFLYGMDLMGKSLEQTAGSKLQGILSTMTASPVRALLLGMAVTAVIQSSGATTVMAVGFVNSGLMELHQAIGVIMGANVGTTVTGWLLSLSGLEGDSVITQMLNPNAWSPILGFIGIWLYTFGKDRRRGVGKIMLGFAILMTGMGIMSSAMSPLADEPWFMQLFLSFKNPVLGVIAGAVLTAVLQSSSASVGILQALCSTGAVTFSAAVPIIMGQNIGTTVTALISSAGANKNAKRTAFVHLYFNLIGTVVFLLGFYGLNAVIGFSFFNETANTFGIAIVHTVFNLVTTAILLPFNRVLERLAIMTVPDSPTDSGEQHSLLDERLLTTPSVAVGRAMLVGGDMAEICRTALLQAMSTTRVWNDAIADEVTRKEDAVDHYEDVLGTYLVKLSAKHLSQDDNRTVNTLLHTIGDFERVSDHAVNLIKAAKEIRDKSIQFSEEALNDLSVLEAAVQDIVNRTVDAFQKNDVYAAKKIEPLEEVVDGLVREVKSRHIMRLQAGACSIEYGFVLDDLLTNYERIADHCSNIAVAMIEVSLDRFDTHEYLNAVKHGDDVKFERRYEKYRDRYTFEPEVYSGTENAEKAENDA
ncbi:Na/Pi cotransporter family protein [Gemmiger sp.]|uniref:Na/Pi cotransporter family protein n=1 Tax=Gemmiger sp. TaxID=2049027 RepID=UPI002A74EDEA|nr:Na/Pi cotransporter family protein [Gemmiger sp.]MDY2695191.1 Na/Pi cotransporter family protein [Gemmiger sp.]MDY6007883.1 Na/Pi cotransporter family protein [Gemmiger sp.]